MQIKLILLDKYDLISKMINLIFLSNIIYRDFAIDY